MEASHEVMRAAEQPPACLMGYPAFAQSERTRVMQLSGRFEGFLRCQLTGDVPRRSHLLDAANQHCVVSTINGAEVRFEHPVMILTTGDGHTAHTIVRTETGGYVALSPEMRLSVGEGLCRTLPEIECGRIVIEANGDNLIVVVRDDRPEFYLWHCLAWWWLDAGKNFACGVAFFETDEFHERAFSAACLPGALSQRVLIAISRCDIRELQ